MIPFDDVKVSVARMRYHFARRIRKGNRILLELRAQFWYLEDPREQTLENARCMLRRGFGNETLIEISFMQCVACATILAAP